jgi:Leucine-rich repeat (LRR) protein
LAPLANLNSLTYLSLNQTSVSDLVPLANLNSLTYLSLNQTSVSDLAPLVKITNLYSLYFCQNNSIELSVLTSLSSLKRLYLYETSVEDQALIQFQGYLPELFICFHLPDSDIITKIESGQKTIAILHSAEAQESKKISFQATLSEAYGELASFFLLAQQFDQALATIQKALVKLRSPSYYVHARHVLGLLFTNQEKEAKDLVLKFKGQRIENRDTFDQIVLRYIEELEKNEINHPYFKEIKRLLS